MSKRFFLILSFIFCIVTNSFSIDSWIRINQLGYLPNASKKAVFISESPQIIKQFTLYDVLTNTEVATFKTDSTWGEFQKFKCVYILDFTKISTQGAYYIKAGAAYSSTIYINKNVYLGAADYLLNYLRHQRCGYHTEKNEFCHPNKCFEVTAPNKLKAKNYKKQNNQVAPPTRFVDVKGGWHDATGYLQYGASSANAIFQLLLAYQLKPNSFSDFYDKAGNNTSNGIPDILDEAKWGLDWLMKMYPSKDTLYHQIADDRGEISIRLSTEDRSEYGMENGTGRPVYLATGESQGLFSYHNNSNGIASIAGKYASAFALGADVFGKIAPTYADSLTNKAFEAYEYGKANPGVCQTVPAKLPFYYKEQNWTDDMELAATQLYRLTYDSKYLQDAASYGRVEPVSPWMCSDSAKFDEWYPTISLGHYFLAAVENPSVRKDFLLNMQTGLDRVKLRAAENPFNICAPLSWNSNVLISSIAAQSKLYNSIVNNNRYLDIETSALDWLFGCNPWGKSMIVKTPKNCDGFLKNSFDLSHKPINNKAGALVNGPVARKFLKNEINTGSIKDDELQRFQTDWGVYHYDNADMTTYEPTLEGTAALAYLLASKQQEGVQEKTSDCNQYNLGGIVRTDKTKKQISLVFTGSDFADGYKTIAETLDKLNIKASFFFTGDFYRNANNKSLIKELLRNNHYLGAHSNKHLLYCSWNQRDSLLVSKSLFYNDLKANYSAMEKYGIYKKDAPFFIPSHEWYNDSISSWCKEVGVQLVNFTPGTLSNADFSIPEMREKYYSSIEIYNRIMQVENKQTLNGYILLFHIGSDERRTDKFYPRLYSLLSELKKIGYGFVDLYKSTDMYDKYGTKPEK